MTALPSAAPEFRAGDRIRTEIGEFEVQKILGAGGMGVVYQVVRDERHGGRQFALKTILPELLSQREAKQRFEAEGRILSKFDHENIVKIDGIFHTLSEPAVPFILMELLQGYTLRFVMENSAEPLAVNDVCTVAIGVCNALEEIHKHNVVHRDIKPDNIFIQKRRKQTRIVLIDFGIMKGIVGVGDGQTTTSFLGSYSHACPEQMLGKAIGPRSDLYSLAASLYEMLTGAPLFPDLRDPRAIGRAHIERRPLPLQECAPMVAPEVAEVIMRALEKEPSARPVDAAAFRRPFTMVRNRILREQALSAGHSTIELFLANPVGVNPLSSVPVAAAKGPPPGMPTSSPALGDATIPSGPPWAGTEPDLPLQVITEQAQGASLSRELDVPPQSGVAKKQVQPPAAVVSPRPDPARVRKPAAQGAARVRRSSSPPEPTPVARQRPRAPYVFLRISLVTAALVGAMCVGRLLTPSAPTSAALPASPPTVTVDSAMAATDSSTATMGVESPGPADASTVTPPAARPAATTAPPPPAMESAHAPPPPRNPFADQK